MPDGESSSVSIYTGQSPVRLTLPGLTSSYYDSTISQIIIKFKVQHVITVEKRRFVERRTKLSRLVCT